MVVSCEICGKQFDSFRGLNGHRNAHIKRAESFTPPASAVKAAKKGLSQRKEWGRGGLSPSEAKAQGIDSGVTRARKIASGSVSRHDVRRMSAFNRHRKNNRPDKKMPDGGPTAGTIAWNLWGGTSGVNWAKKKSAAMNAESCCQDPLLCDGCMAVCLDCNPDANAGGDVCQFCTGEAIERFDAESDSYEWEWDRTDNAPTELIKKRLKEAGFKLDSSDKGYGNIIVEFYEPQLVAKNGNLLDVTLSQNEEFDGFSRLTFYDDNDENTTGRAPPMDWDILYEKGLLKGEDGVVNPQGDYYQAYWDGLYDEWKNGHNCADNAKFDIYEDNFIVMECEVCGKTSTFEQKTPYEGLRKRKDAETFEAESFEAKEELKTYEVSVPVLHYYGIGPVEAYDEDEAADEVRNNWSYWRRTIEDNGDWGGPLWRYSPITSHEPEASEIFASETLDYNSFTNDMEALLAKYSQLLLTYETEYQSKERGGDGIMEVFMRFKPYNAYFDDVDLDAEDGSFEDFKRRMVGDEAVAGDVGYIEALEEFYQEYLDDYKGSNPESFEEFQERTLREDYADESFDAEAPHYHGDCDDCKQPMMLGKEIKNRWGFDELTPSKICQECDHVVCGSCQPQAKVCPHCNESFDADFGPVDEEGQLAKALAAVREKSKRYAPTPLRLTKLPHPDQKTLYDKYEADVIIGHSPYPDILGSTTGNWHRTSNFCWKCGDLYHHHSNCKSPQKYTDALTRKKDMLKSVNAAIKLYSSIQTPLSDSDVEDLKELRRMIKNNHFGIARHYFNSLDTAVRDNIGYETEISFEADEWKLLPRDAKGRWQKPVRSESINELRDSLQTSVPAISELLEMYGGDTPNNRYKLYNDLQSLKIDAMDSALPDDSTASLDMSWMTPSEYYQYVLEEPLDISDDIEDDTQTIEFQDRFVRYTAMTMSPQVIDALIEENELEIVSDLFADPAEAEGEIAFLKAVKRYQRFSEEYSAE